MASAAETLQSHLEFLLEERAGPLSGDQRRFLDTAVRYGELLVRLAEDLRTVALAESGELELSCESFDLAQVALEAVDQLWPVAHVEHKPIDVREDGPVMIEGDKKRIGRAILELLSDALDVAYAGQAIRLSLLSDGLEIAYEGEGLPPESSLALAVSMARLHGGELVVCDADGAISLALTFETAPVTLRVAA